MGEIRNEDVIGYRFIYGGNAEIVCESCIEQKEMDEATEEEILLQDEIDNGDVRLFCDRCGKELPNLGPKISVEGPKVSTKAEKVIK